MLFYFIYRFFNGFVIFYLATVFTVRRHELASLSSKVTGRRFSQTPFFLFGLGKGVKITVPTSSSASSVFAASFKILAMFYVLFLVSTQ